MCAQNVSRDTFLSISKPRPECGSRRLPETHFQAFPSAGQNVSPEDFQRDIFKHFQADASMWAQNASRDTFSSISKPRPECGPRIFQRHIFKHFQAHARMWAHKASRDSFSTISKPRPECGPRRLPKTHFQAFPALG